jgi:UDP-N-acetylglucosamine acyltransferase
VIHPTAIIHSKATVDPTADVGPYSIVDADVEVGPHCSMGPHVYLTGRTVIGAHNRFFAGCIIGEAPQDLKYQGEPTGLRIGDHNVFREHVTVHRSSKVEQETTIGSHNFLMQHCHVGHNAAVGDSVILAGGALLAGYVTVADRAFISGNCVVHQFVRVGSLALMQGGSAISKDLPPFTIARGENGICGLNTVGLRRAGFPASDRLELKQVYRVLFREGQKLSAALDTARKQFSSKVAITLIDFVSSSKRGVCVDDKGGPALDDEPEDD